MNGNAVNDPRGLASEGLHVSTYEDWNETMDHLGGAYEAGVKIKQSLN